MAGSYAVTCRRTRRSGITYSIFSALFFARARIPASVSSCQVDRSEETRLKGFSTLYRRETFSQAHQGNFSHYPAAKWLEPDVKGINKTCKDTENMMF